MRTFRTVVFSVVSIFLLLSSCSIRHHSGYKKTSEQPNISAALQLFREVGDKQLFNAHIQAFDKEFSGLLLVKKTQKEQHRFVFLTHTGMKIFEAEQSNNSFQMHYIVSFLDKKMIKKVLFKDLEMLTQTPNLGESSFYKHRKDASFLIKRKKKPGFEYWKIDKEQLIWQENSSCLWKGTVLSYFYDADKHLKRLNIKHNGIKISWDLEPIKR